LISGFEFWVKRGKIEKLRKSGNVARQVLFKAPVRIFLVILNVPIGTFNQLRYEAPQLEKIEDKKRSHELLKHSVAGFRQLKTVLRARAP